MPSLPSSFEVFQEKRLAVRREALRRGFVHFVLTHSPVSFLIGALTWTCLLFLRGTQYVRSRGPAYWIGAFVVLLTVSTLSAAYQFLTLKRGVDRDQAA